MSVHVPTISSVCPDAAATRPCSGLLETRLSGWISLNMAACSALSHSANLSVCISNLCVRVCLINAGTDHSLNMESSCDRWFGFVSVGTQQS